MPFYPRSAMDLLLAKAMPDDLVDLIAVSVFKAVKYLHSKGFCFGDIKPTNIMLGAAEPVLIDLAAIVPLGDMIVESSMVYCLDSRLDVASEVLDYFCLGSTISQLMGVQITTRGSLLQYHQLMPEKAASCIAVKCLSFDPIT